MKPNTLSNLLTAAAFAAALILLLLSSCTDISVSPPENMTITYNLKVESGGGGSVSPTAQSGIAAETPVNVRATPYNGYIFSSWSLTSGLAQFVDANSASTSVLLGWNATIKAYFVSVYSITFNINGATGTTPATVSQILYGNSIKLPGKGDMTRTGYQDHDSIKYTFGGWNTNNSGTGYNYSADSMYRVTGNVTLYARWIPNYTVRFGANGASGEEPATIIVESGNSIKLPGKGDMTRTGYQDPDSIKYTFGGWNTSNSGIGNNYNAGETYKVTSNVTLYARWIPIYPVKFNANNATSGEAPATITADSGRSITLPSRGTLTKDGYFFVGWNEKSDGTGTNYNAGSSYMVRNNITLYAIWSDVYIVYFNGNGATSGSVPAMEVKLADSNKNITLPDKGNLVRMGYNFVGWNEKSNGTGTNYNAGSSYTVRNIITLYANWTYTFIDSRDGKTYKAVEIGNQRWMAENLNYDTADGGGSWCYAGDTGNCNSYGRLYNWNTAMAGSSSSNANPSGVRGICPNGWHLPSRAEWNTLVDYVGGSAGTKLKAKNGWNGTNDLGFSALPGGGRYSGGSFRNVGANGNWWTATEYGSSDAYYRYIVYNGVDEYLNDKSDAFSVRCVQD